MSEKENQNDTLLEESRVLSDSPLQDTCHSKDKLGPTGQVPDRYVLICVSVYTYVYMCVCLSVCSLEMHI